MKTNHAFFLWLLLLPGIRGIAQTIPPDMTFAPDNAENFVECDQPYTDPCVNMIGNPHFYPTVSGSAGNFEIACPWTYLLSDTDDKHGGTTDLFTTGYNTIAPGLGVPNNMRGTQYDHSTGTNTGSYAGFYTYAPYVTLNTEWREYVMYGYPLVLLAGHTYNVEFYVSLGEHSTYATEIQAAFFSARPSFLWGFSSALTTITPQYTSSIVTEYVDWERLSFTFTPTASGSYYFAVGNFRNNINTPKTAVSLPAGTIYTQQNCSYYYLDDVRIWEDTEDECCNYDHYFIDHFTTGEPDMNYGGNLFDGNYTPVSFFTNSNNISPGDKIYMAGEILIDQNFTFDNNEVVFGAGTRLVIDANVSLTITNSYLHGCDTLWSGIANFISGVNSGTSLIINNSIIEDMQEGIFLKNTPTTSITESQLRNNLAHITLENGGTWPLTFYKNRLTCPQPLKTSYNGAFTSPTYTWTAMSVINVGHVNLAPLTTLADSNAFRDADTGLKIINSEVRLANAIFENINKNGGQSWCVHAVAGSDLRILDIVDRVGTSPVLPNKFSKSDNGILIEGDVNRVFEANIKRNAFVDIEGAGVAVHRHINPSNDIYYGHIDISNNNFSTSVGKPGMLTGIYVKDTDRLFVTILSNNIVNGANRTGSEGIVVTNAVYNVATGIANSTYYKIINNDIDRFQRGIYTAFLTEPKIEGNDVILNGTGTHQYHGIWVNNNRTPNILANDIHGTFQDWRSIGLRMENSFASQVGCNFTEQTGIAHWYQLGNDPAKIFYNEMDDYHTAIAVTAGAIGIQYKFGNVPYTMRNKWEKNATNDELFAEGGTDAVGNRFYLATSTGPYEENITDFSSISTGGPAIEYYAFPQIGGDYNDDAIAGRIGTYSYTCPPEDATVIKPNGWNLGAFLKKAGAVSEFTEENDWHRSRQAYGFLRDNPGYLDSSAVIEDWYDSTHLTNTRYFHEVYEKLAEKDFSGAITVNNSITPSGSMETAYQDFLGILISEYYQADTLPGYTLTFIARAMIEDMADNCPVEYGDLVFMARRFLLDVAGDANEIISDCEENYYMPTGAAKWAQSQNEEKVTVSVYPNPAKDALYITSAGDAMYQLVDITGRVIMAGRIYEGTFDLPLAGILPGVYNFVIVNHDSVLQTTRIVIMH